MFKFIKYNRFFSCFSYFIFHDIFFKWPKYLKNFLNISENVYGLPHIFRAPVNPKLLKESIDACTEKENYQLISFNSTISSNFHSTLKKEYPEENLMFENFINYTGILSHQVHSNSGFYNIFLFIIFSNLLFFFLVFYKNVYFIRSTNKCIFTSKSSFYYAATLLIFSCWWKIYFSKMHKNKLHFL